MEVLDLSPRRTRLIVWTLMALMPLFGMVVDLLSPALPAIARTLGASSQSVQNLISLYLLGYAVGNFVSGFLTDAWGRRQMLLYGMLAFIVVSLLPLLLPGIRVLLLVRLCQGLAIGSISVVARSVYPDILPPAQLVRIGIMTGSMFGLGPIIGPLLGAYLQSYFGWQACFVFLAASTAVLWLMVALVLPETHFRRQTLQPAVICRNLGEVLRHRQFMGLVVMMGAVYSLGIAFNTAGPFIIQVGMHYSPVFFGHIALLLGLCFMLATFVCRFLVHRLGVERLQAGITWLLMVISLAALLVGHWLGNHVLLLTLVSACMLFAQGFVFPMSMGHGLSLFRHMAGTATATMFLINILMTALTASLVALCHVQSSQALFVVYLLLSLLCFAAWRLLIYRRPAPAIPRHAPAVSGSAQVHRNDCR